MYANHICAQTAMEFGVDLHLALKPGDLAVEAVEPAKDPLGVRVEVEVLPQSCFHDGALAGAGERPIALEANGELGGDAWDEWCSGG